MLYDKIQLESDEKILVKARRHWFILFSQLLGFFIAACAPFLIFLIADRTLIETSLTFLLSDYLPQIGYLYAVWLLFLWIGAFGVLTNHYLDILAVTNRRVILINQKGLWRRSTGSFRLERLQDVHVEVHGIIATLLNFGSLDAETAGTDKEEFNAHGLPRPRELRSIITTATDDLIKEYRSRPLSTDGL